MSAVTLMRGVAQVAAIAASSYLFAACSGSDALNALREGELGRTYANAKLRLDRQPLTDAQRDADAAALRVGAYRTRADAPISGLIPLMANADKLPQSDCLWVAQQSQGGVDLIKLHWEGVFEPNQNRPPFDQYRDDERIGMCRVDHPETRLPPHYLGEALEFESLDPSEADVLQTLGDIADSGDNFPRFQADVAILGGRLSELHGEFDAHRSCPDDGLANPVRMPLNVRDGSAASARFDGVQDEDGNVSLCTPTGTGLGGGYRVAPTHDVVAYEFLFEPVLPTMPLPGPDSPLHEPARLGPLVLRATDTTVIARPAEFQVGTRRLAWQTERTSDDGGGGVRWRENFSSSIFVSKVRLFTESGNTRRYLDVGTETLCIKDYESGSNSCRFRINPSRNADNASEFPLPSTVTVTPTYAHDSLAARAIVKPMQWELIGPAGIDLSRVFFEFTLDSNFPETAMSAGGLIARSPRVDLGTGPRDTPRNARVELVNVGSRSVRITQVGVLANVGQASEFTVRLPYAPQPVPLPIAITFDKTFSMKAGNLYGPDDPELLTIDRRLTWQGLQFQPPAGTRWRYQGRTLEIRQGTAFRDSADLLPPPIRSGDASRPLQLVTWGERRVPFELAPGAAFEVMAIATPRCCNERTATVQVAWENARTRQTMAPLSILLRARVLADPQIDVLPAALTFAPNQIEKRFLLTSTGGQTDTLRAIRVMRSSGYGSFALAGPVLIGARMEPGAVEIATVTFTPPLCTSGVPRSGTAQGRVEIDALQGMRTVSLGASYPACR